MTELPTTFGKYFLTEKLATGGMAEIYLAKLVGPGGFEKQLVIKQILPKLSGQRHFVDLFVTEAKTLVTLSHGNIVPVYELGVIEDTYFIAMEYIDGPTLYRLTEALARKDTRMDPALAAWISARILEGLDYAHRKGEGVIHRDLSPRNVMLSRDGEVKLVDFGIAVTLGASDEGSAGSPPTGSFPYMSPEQARREPLNGQTDLFSTGVLLWEMLVGRRLFARSSADDTLAAVTSGEIARPSSLRDDVPAKLDDVVMRALERDRGARWESASDMLAALQRYLYVLDTPPGPRDLGAVVAKHCPPETRRLPTHAEGARNGASAAENRADTEVTPPPAGPRTAVLPRETTEAKGKARARTETFATNVELKNMLERATPLFPIAAITETTPVPRPAAEPEARPEPEADAVEPRTSMRAIPRAERSSIIEVEPAERAMPGQAAPSSPLLVVLALGTLVIGAVAIVMVLRARGAATVDVDAALVVDAPLVDAPVAPVVDAAIDAANDIVDARAAAPLADAAPPARDAAPRVRPQPPADAAPRATGSAILKVGANPWGEVVVDGVARGRTPLQLTLPAGKHVVEVIFKGEDPPRTAKRTVDLTHGEIELVDVDFTKP